MNAAQRRPPLFQPPASLFEGKIASLEAEVEELKRKLRDAAPKTWEGLRGPAKRARVIVSKEGLIQSIPLPKAMERDIAWHTDGRMGKVEATFNPSIFKTNDGRIWMAYRVECFPWFRFSRVAIVQLNQLYCPIAETNQILELPTRYDNYNAEDPRFVAHTEDGILLAYNDGFRQHNAVLSYPGFEVQSHRQFDRVHGLALAEKEKNWTFFSQGVGAIYSINPLRILTIGDEVTCGTAFQWNPDWPHGELRGGTPLFDLNGIAAHFFHSSMKIADSRHGPVRQYFSGVLCHDGGTMRPVAISERPILIGSPCAIEDRPSQHQVVFPCGLVDLGDAVAVSYGLDDWECALEVVDKSAIMDGLRKL